MVTSPKKKTSPARRRRRRVDAEHNVGLILDAATRTLGDRADASIEDIAKAAGLSRQTVYAHFPSRDVLLDAVVERASAEVTAALDSTRLEDEPPAAALLRLLELGWETIARYPFLWHLPGVSKEEDVDRHGPILELMEALIARGQRSGEIDTDLSPAWLLTAALALGRAAEDEVKGGRMTVADATHSVHTSTLRLLGLHPEPLADERDEAGALRPASRKIQ